MTNHGTLYFDSWTETQPDGSKREVIQQIVRCLGCKAASILEQWHNPGSGAPEAIVIPPRLWVRRPAWLDQIEGRDDKMFALLQEVYSATNEAQSALLAMGVRAALDHVMTRIVGDIGGFEQKLEQMVEIGQIGEKQKKMLEVVIDAASAAAHRSYRPAIDLLEQMLSVAETIIRDHYITGPMLDAIQLQIPPRPPRHTTGAPT